MPSDSTAAAPLPTTSAITAPINPHPANTLPLTTLPVTLQHSHGNDIPPSFPSLYPPPTIGLTAHDVGGPSLTAPLSQPLMIKSNRCFDEFGFPMHTTGSSSTIRSPFRGSYVRPPTTGRYEPQYEFSHMDPYAKPPHGLGTLENKVWVPGAEFRLRKLKMPIFDGTDAFGWVYRLERYFDIQGFVTTGEKLRTAVLCMEGQALAWYRWVEGRAPFQHWEELKGRLLERFQPSHEGDIYEQFLAIEQSGTVREYIGAFETLAAQLVNVPEKVMEGTFIKGLKPEVRSSVRMLQPIGLTQTIKTALLTDEVFEGERRTR